MVYIKKNGPVDLSSNLRQSIGKIINLIIHTPVISILKSRLNSLN